MISEKSKRGGATSPIGRDHGAPSRAIALREDRGTASGLIRGISRTYRWAYLDMPAILIGVAGGAGAILFRNAIELIHEL